MRQTEGYKSIKISSGEMLISDKIERTPEALVQYHICSWLCHCVYGWLLHIHSNFPGVFTVWLFQQNNLKRIAIIFNIKKEEIIGKMQTGKKMQIKSCFKSASVACESFAARSWWRH